MFNEPQDSNRREGMRFLLEWAGLTVMNWALLIIILVIAFESWYWVFTKPEYLGLPLYQILAVMSSVAALVMEFVIWRAREVALGPPWQ